MSFIKSFFASFLAVIVAVLIGIPLLFVFIIGIAASFGNSQEEVKVPRTAILHLQLNSPISETQEDNPVGIDLDKYLPFPAGVSTKTIGLYQLNKKIRQATEDDRVKGIYLNLNGTVQTGWANLSSIREELQAFRASGKFIYAYSEIYGEKAYYLASVADSVFLPPEGILEFNGLASSRMFYLGMFEKLELQPEIFRVGTFKSAVEPYLRKDMSEASKMQTKAYLNDLWKVYGEEVAISRSIPFPKLNQITNESIISKASAAKEQGLVDLVAYESEVFIKLKAAVDKTADEEQELLSFQKYMRVPGKYTSSRDRIAIIFAEGAIQSGKSQEGVIGSETVVKQLRKARKDKKVKAVVFRINSPGGSALASDVIADEVRLLKAEKPVIASFGDVAASGGYYIAAPCDKIFAQENTITGSIGIFGLWMNVRKAAEDNLGLTFDAVETHEHANFGDPTFPMTPAEKAFMQRNVEQGYSSFIDVVKNGRGFADSAAVDAIAQGRVWSGMAAKERKLVDEFGDLEDALAFAAKEIGVDEYRIQLMQPSLNPFEEIMEELLQGQLAKDPLYEEMKQLRELKRRFPKNGLYALMPYDLRIE